MSRPFEIPKYTSKDLEILVGSMLPLAFIVNYFLYGARYFSGAGIFICTTLTSFVFFGMAFLTYGMVAVFFAVALSG